MYRLFSFLLIVFVSLTACGSVTGDSVISNSNDAPVESAPGDTTTGETLTSTPDGGSVEETDSNLEQRATDDGAVSPSVLVSQFYAALNTENLDETAALWPGGDQEFLRLLTEGFHVKLSASCSPAQDDENAIQCVEDVGRHDFYTPAGLKGSITVLYKVEDGQIVDRTVVAFPESFESFEEDFGQWLQDAYPDIFEAAYQGTGEYPIETAEGAQQVLPLIEEFMAQSDDYPVSE